jgi:iron complex transport system permease protein
MCAMQTALVWMAGSLHTATWPLLVVATCWALPAALILFVTARASDVALLGHQAAAGLGVRMAWLMRIRFIAGVIDRRLRLLCGQHGFVGLIAPHMARFLLRGGQVALLSGSALLGALLVLVADSLGRLAFAPLQIPAGIVISLTGGPFFLLLLWQRRDRL